jgi:hypothetical protein
VTVRRRPEITESVTRPQTEFGFERYRCTIK